MLYWIRLNLERIDPCEFSELGNEREVFKTFEHSRGFNLSLTNHLK